MLFRDGLTLLEFRQLFVQITFKLLLKNIERKEMGG